MLRVVCHRLCALSLLAACTRESPNRSAQDPEPGGTELAGGNSGAEGGFVCTDVRTPLATLDTRSEALGASAADLLALANRTPQVSLRWPKRDSGPMLMADSSLLSLSVSARGSAAELICDGIPEGLPEGFRPKPRIELPVLVTLRSEDGVLAAQLESTLSAESAERASIGPLSVPALMFGGSLGTTVAGFYTSANTLSVELKFGPGGATGWLGGPFSRNPICAYTAYAYWPSDATCWPVHAGEPSDDRDAMTPHLARVNQTFAWTWSDGKTTRATLTVQTVDGETCDDHGQVNHAVTVRIKTADGRVDLSLPARLSGGPGTLYPWPVALQDVEPFTLDLSASVALDAAALATQLGYSDPAVSAAIVSFYLSSPVGIFSPPLEGRLYVVPIERSGFSDRLPTVELALGSEGCYSSSGVRRELLAAELRTEGFVSRAHDAESDTPQP